MTTTLHWRATPTHHEAEAPFGWTFVIRRGIDSFRLSMGRDIEAIPLGHYPTLDAAKDAANRHVRAEIQGWCIDHTPARASRALCWAAILAATVGTAINLYLYLTIGSP